MNWVDLIFQLAEQVVTLVQQHTHKDHNATNQKAVATAAVSSVLQTLGHPDPVKVADSAVSQAITNLEQRPAGTFTDPPKAE